MNIKEPKYKELSFSQDEKESILNVKELLTVLSKVLRDSNYDLVKCGYEDSPAYIYDSDIKDAIDTLVNLVSAYIMCNSKEG